ncbi:hypothetical protein Q3G72_001104 [Acer saccharum]|nr:hypothetical protein Q3G72_001104 [Acer saccharum]
MKTFEKLKNIKLSYSPNLIETPDFTRVPNLETLNLEEDSSESYGLNERLISCTISIGSRWMTYMIGIPSDVHSDHLWLGYLSIQEMIETQYSDPNDLRCIHVRDIQLSMQDGVYSDPNDPDNDALNSVADNRSPIFLPAKRCGIRMVYESELENFEEFPTGSNVLEHHDGVCDPFFIFKNSYFPHPMISESNSLCLRAPSNNSLWHYK